MDLAFLLILPGLLWVQAWNFLGFSSNSRALGVTAGVVAITLFGVVLFQDNLPMGIQTPTDAQGPLLGGAGFVEPAVALSVFILAWVVYAALVSGVYLWGMEARSLGFYSLFIWIISTVYAVYFFVGDRILDSGEIVNFTWLLGVAAILLAVLAALQFFYLALRPAGQEEPSPSVMRTTTGWFYLVGSVAIVVLGGLFLLGINPSL